jgi:hypothetical protein
MALQPLQMTWVKNDRLRLPLADQSSRQVITQDIGATSLEALTQL